VKTVGLLDSLTCSFSGVAEPDVNGCEFLPADSGRLAQGGSDNAAAHIRRSRVVLRKLVTGKISSGPGQVSIDERCQVGAHKGSLLEFAAGCRNLFSYFCKVLQQTGACFWRRRRVVVVEQSHSDRDQCAESVVGENQVSRRA